MEQLIFFNLVNSPCAWILDLHSARLSKATAPATDRKSENPLSPMVVGFYLVREMSSIAGRGRDIIKAAAPVPEQAWRSAVNCSMRPLLLMLLT